MSKELSAPNPGPSDPTASKTTSRRMSVGVGQQGGAGRRGSFSPLAGGSKVRAGGPEVESLESKKERFSAGEMAEFRELFNLIDTDRSGQISRDELGNLVCKSG